MMEKPIIQEIIVVEGRDDTTALNRAVIADTIETGGSAINQKILEEIKHAKEKRGVIIFTDPDFPGEKIRKTIEAYVPGCKHAFIERKDALPKSGRGLGVEHASVEVIQNALLSYQTSGETANETLVPREKIIASGLLFGAGAKLRREKLGDFLRIGYTNGKQLEARLKMFGITETEFDEALQAVLQEEKNE
ncbi:ribonuclease M5 [Listeria fleischmannii]|nr:ribonuclease M5 [Listeria fleischmannii]